MAQPRPHRRDNAVLLAAVILALLHHTDHVLRADHSGWPFLAEVTPFTFSLLIYPLFVGIYLARAGWLRVTLAAIVLLFVLVVHATIEPPTQLYTTWATGASVSAERPGVPNLLHTASPALAVASLAVLALLLAALAVLIVRTLNQPASLR